MSLISPISSHSATAVSTGAHYRPKNLREVGIAHGVVMLLAFGLMFPLGGVWLRALRLKSITRLHSYWQLLAYSLALTGFVLGVWVSSHGGHGTFKSPNGHKQFGLTLFIVMTMMPILGISHHLLFKKLKNPTVYGLIHRWIGRLAIIGGCVNIGLGLQLGHIVTLKRIIPYATITGICGLAYITFGALHGPERRCPFNRAKKANTTSEIRLNSVDTTDPPSSLDVEKEAVGTVRQRGSE